MDASSIYAESEYSMDDTASNRSPSRSQTRSLTRDLMANGHDSPRSVYRKNDSGFITNSSESREESPARDLLRRHRSRSPRYPNDLYKPIGLDSLRSYTLLHTFEDMEHEKFALKDENRDMKELALQLQNSVRLLEAARIRDSERFTLQEREVDALKAQLKTEKEDRQSSAVLVEQLQTDLTRKADLLTLSNEELIEAREKLRSLDKQLTDESTSKLQSERAVREYREKIEDYANELEMERNVSRASLDAVREAKDHVARLQDELFLANEAVKAVSNVFETPLRNSANPLISVKNKETTEYLRNILIQRNAAGQQLTDLEKQHSSRTGELSNLAEEIQNFARIMKAETAEEVVGNTLMHDGTLRDQVNTLQALKKSPAFEPLAKAVIQYIEFEIRKRKMTRDSIDAAVKKVNWQGIGLNTTQLIPFVNAVLMAWSDLKGQNVYVSVRLNSVRKQLGATSLATQEAKSIIRTFTSSFKKEVLSVNRHRLEEELLKLTESTKQRHEAVRKYLEAAHQMQMTAETNRLKTDHESTMDEAINMERSMAKKLERKIETLETSLQSKENENAKIQNELRDVESRLFRKTEETKKQQKEHAISLDVAGKKHQDDQQTLQQKMDELQKRLEGEIARAKREIDQRTKTIALLDETVVAKDQRISQLQARAKDQEAKIEESKRLLELEKDPSKNQKLYAAIKGYEREVADLRAKITERDTLVTHLKRRVDEALNRGQKKVNEVIERNRSEVAARNAKVAEREKELEKMQDQLTRLSRVAAKGNTRNRETALSADPVPRNVLNVKSVSGNESTRFPPILPAGLVGGDPKSNGQLSRRTTARSESREQTGRTMTRSSSVIIR